MLAGEIETLFPREWELARQKYKRDRKALLDLFETRAEEPRKDGQTVKKSDT